MIVVVDSGGVCRYSGCVFMVVIMAVVAMVCALASVGCCRRWW